MTSLAVRSSCVVTQTPMGTNSSTRRRKRQFPLLFVNCDRGRIEIDHLYGLCCRGWYCNPEQHSLCWPARPRRPAQLVLFRIAVPTTPAQTVSWSIPIMAYSALSHYCNQCWVIVNYTSRNKLQWNFNQNTKLLIHENASESTVCEMAAILSRGRWVNTLRPGQISWLFVDNILTHWGWDKMAAIFQTTF